MNSKLLLKSPCKLRTMFFLCMNKLLKRDRHKNDRVRVGQHTLYVGVPRTERGVKFIAIVPRQSADTKTTTQTHYLFSAVSLVLLKNIKTLECKSINKVKKVEPAK